MPDPVGDPSRDAAARRSRLVRRIAGAVMLKLVVAITLFMIFMPAPKPVGPRPAGGDVAASPASTVRGGSGS